MSDWADTQEKVLSDEKIHEEFQKTDRYEDALILWHQLKHPEEWGND